MKTREPVETRQTSALLRIGFACMQAAAVLVIILSIWVDGIESDAAAIAAASVTLTLSVIHATRRGRITQCLSAVVALIAACILLQNARSQSTRRVKSDAGPTKSVEQRQSRGRPNDSSGPRHPRAVTPRLNPLAQNKIIEPGDSSGLSAEAISTGAPTEDEPAEKFGGVTLPDLGDGTPFEQIAMTKSELRLFERLFVDYWNNYKQLADGYENGNVDYDRLVEESTSKGDELTAELEAALGTERTHILTAELQRYLARMAQQGETPEFDDEEMQNSPLYHVVARAMGFEDSND